MLQLVLGRSGRGKTHYIYHRLAETAAHGRPGILLVPEQYSFESERALLSRLGMRDAASVQVLSFTRMAERVFAELGGLNAPRMDDATRTLLMSRALEQVADQLTLYRRHVTDTACIGAMLSLLSECKQCAVTPALLTETAGHLEDGTLRRKTEELSLIFSAYQALAEQSYLDPLDDLTLLAEKLPESRLLRGAAVFVDGFKGFTAQEMGVLEVILGLADELTVALCTDTLTDTEEGFGLFSSVTRTANRLQELAKRRLVPVAKPVILEENHRVCCEPLRVLEDNCFAPLPEVYEEEAPQVTVTACGDIYDECAYVARTIRRLLREQGGRCREYAVVARNLPDYQGILENALAGEGIPCYMDRRENVLTDPLIAAVLSALRCAVGSLETDELLRLMKTGMVGFSAHSAALVENYVFVWQIGGESWKNEWKGNPAGWDIRADKEADKKLAYLNLLRRRLMSPLLSLRRSLEGQIDGEAFATAIYRYLMQVRADRMVRLQAARLRAAGEPVLAQRQARMWEVLMEMLDRFAAALGSSRSSASRWAELFDLVAGETDLGDIPQGLDAVQIGSADRIRFSAPETVFMLGVNEGVFPAYPQTGSLISDAERRRLIELGVPMADTGDLQAVEERFFAYAALSAPSRRLYVSYLQGNTAGETFVPSAVVTMLDTVLPRHQKGYALRQDGTDIESAADAFSRLTAAACSPTVGASLRAALAEQPAYARRLAVADAMAEHRPAAFRDAGAAARFFGDDMRLSPSRVEQYHRCRFAYFCRYGLGVQAPRPAELDSARFGTLIHYVMEQLLPEYVKQGLTNVTREAVNADAAFTVQRYVEEQMGAMQERTSRFDRLLKRLCDTAGNLLWRVILELRQSRFVPVDYELGVGIPNGTTGEMVPATVLTLPDGARVRVVGVVDRVDVCREGETAYVRVVDYKTGAKEFRLSEVVEGINVQMLIYLFSLWQNGGPRYGTVTPAGVLYLPSKQPVIRVERCADEETVEKERLRSMRMNGLLLDDPAILRAMEPEAAGLFIPARLDKAGRPARGSSVASLAQLGRLKKKIETLLTDMAASLRRGDVAALPLRTEKNTACDHCDFRAVCGHEPNDPVRFLLKTDNQAVWEELERETGSAAASIQLSQDSPQ